MIIRPYASTNQLIDKEFCKKYWAFNKVLLNIKPKKRGIFKRRIWFVSAYADLPAELIHQRMMVVTYDQNYLMQYTEHKDILFNFPFVMGEYAAVPMDLKAKNYDEFSRIIEWLKRELNENLKFVDKLFISGIHILFLKALALFPESKLPVVNHHYTHLLITSNFRKLLFRPEPPMQKVQNYANLLNITPNYLNLVLKSVTGKNVSEHIAEAIVVRSKYLLIHSKLSLKEVASRLGFSSASYFTRYFRNQTGVNPLDWFTHQLSI